MNIEDTVSPDAETETNAAGGKQSHIPVRFDLIDGPALFEMAGVLHEGAEKYGANNWRKIPVEDHLNHLIMHAYAYLSGDTTDDHLSHIMCRAMFAQAVDISDEEVPKDTALDQCYVCRKTTSSKYNCCPKHVPNIQHVACRTCVERLHPGMLPEPKRYRFGVGDPD